MKFPQVCRLLDYLYSSVISVYSVLALSYHFYFLRCSTSFLSHLLHNPVYLSYRTFSLILLLLIFVFLKFTFFYLLVSQSQIFQYLFWSLKFIFGLCLVIIIFLSIFISFIVCSNWSLTVLLCWAIAWLVCFKDTFYSEVYQIFFLFIRYAMIYP